MNLYKIMIEYSIVFKRTPGKTNNDLKPVFTIAKSRAEARKKIEDKLLLKKVTDKLLFQPPYCAISDINIKDIEEVQFTDLSTYSLGFIK